MPAVRRHLLLVSLVIGASLAAPSAATAGSVRFGSDLSPDANVVESHGADTVYWNRTVATERPGPPAYPNHPTDSSRRYVTAASPVDGQLRYVTIHGGVMRGGGLGHIRFVVLRPAPDGSVRVVAIDHRTTTLPVTTDPRHRVPQKDYNWKLCLRKGDYLGVWKIGHGDVRIFAEVPGSVMGWYENAAGIATGNVFTGTPSTGRELLMEALVTTGQDAFSRCPGGYKDHIYEGLDLNRSARLKRGQLVVGAGCPRATYGGCFGRLAVRATLAGGRTRLGSVPVSVPSGRRVLVRIPLAAAHAAVIRRRGSLNAEAVLEGHDDPSDPRNRSAPRPRPGRQSATDIFRVVLRP